MASQKNTSILTGTMITTGAVIGAGIFSLPVVSSGMWFILSMVALVVVWYLSYLISLVLLEVNCHFEPGVSFDTFVTEILGKTWNLLAGLGVAFLLYILLYAYFSAFGSMAAHVLEVNTSNNNVWSNGLMSLVIGGFLAFIVWMSTAFVGRIATLLVIGMGIAYVLSMSGLSFQIEAAKLFNQGDAQATYFPYLWKGLPYFLTAFGFSSMVPSLYKYYGKDPTSIRKALLYGSLIALLVYIVFILVCFGTIGRNGFIAINQAGGNMGDLVGALTSNSEGASISFALTSFSNFAIISSFLGVGLSLFDYIADKFGFSDDATGRFYTACITFLPSGIASFFFPHGFIAAIGYAGLALAFSYILVPVLMAWKLRSTKGTAGYQLLGGKPILVGILGLSAVIVACQVLAMIGYLPVF